MTIYRLIKVLFYVQQSLVMKVRKGMINYGCKILNFPKKMVEKFFDFCSVIWISQSNQSEKNNKTQTTLQRNIDIISIHICSSKYIHDFNQTLPMNGLDILSFNFMYLSSLYASLDLDLIQIIFLKKQMAKKIGQLKQNKLKGKNSMKDLSDESLKMIAIKKIQSLSKKNRIVSKLSKKGFEHNFRNRVQTQVKKQLFSQILEESKFQCPVCLQLMIEPTLLECGHAYCWKCLQEMMIYKSCCGVCRNVQTQPEFQKSKSLQNIIESMIIKKSQHYLDYYCRLTDTENWRRVRNIPITQLCKGVFVDFRDKQLKWRKGEIMKLTYNQTSSNYDMVIRYKKDGLSIEQIIQSNSGRYTRFSYYTRMRYLQQKSNLNGMMEQFIDGQVMEIPFIISGDEDIGSIMQGNGSGRGSDGTQLNQENIAVQQSPVQLFNSFAYSYNTSNTNSFLDELLNSNDVQQPLDIIELLG